MTKTINMMAVGAAIVATVLASCGRDANWHPVNDRDSFIEIEGKDVLQGVELSYPLDLIAVGKTMLIQDRNLPDDNMLMAIDLDGENAPTYLARMGMGPGEFLNTRIVDYFPEDSCLYIFDSSFSRGRFYKISPDSVVASEDNMIAEYKFPFESIGDNHPVVGGFATNSVGDGMMFAIVDTAGQAVARFGKYPGDNTGIDNPGKFFMGHQTVIAANRNRGRFVAGGSTSDWLAFYSIDGERPELIKEYFSFESPVDVTETHSEKTAIVSSRDNENTRKCFRAMLPAKDNVFAVYSGNSQHDRDNGTALPTVLMKFDWDGNFIKGYELPKGLGAKTVTEDGKYLYAVCFDDNDNPSIKRFELP